MYLVEYARLWWGWLSSVSKCKNYNFRITGCHWRRGCPKFLYISHKKIIYIGSDCFMTMCSDSMKSRMWSSQNWILKKTSVKQKIKTTNLTNLKFFMKTWKGKASEIKEHRIGFHGNINLVIIKKHGRMTLGYGLFPSQNQSHSTLIES